MKARFVTTCTVALVAATAAACGSSGSTASDTDAGNSDAVSDAAIDVSNDGAAVGDDATMEIDGSHPGDGAADAVADGQPDVTSEGGGADADASGCSGSDKMCGGQCTDTATDVSNCGGCSIVCGAGTVCASGHCAATCGTLTTCTPDGGATYCASTGTDNANCGSCGHSCAGGTVCSGGQCKLTCGALTTCAPDGGAAYCASTDTDNANCGSCGHTCGAGTVCSGGSCKTTCGSSLVECGGTCVDGQDDPGHCGAKNDCAGANAGVACATGQSCISGACVCDNKVVCAGACVDTTSDTNNCGGCGNVCGGLCVNGTCVGSCASLLALQPNAPSGSYLIDPDGVGPQPAYAAYCDMTDDGGGWTLALKVDGGNAASSFLYGSLLWTNTATLNDATADLATSEAKYRSFSSISASSVRLVVADTTASASAPPTNSLIIPLGASATLLSLVNGPYTATSLGRAAWVALGDGATLQPNCNQEGFNANLGAPYSHVRIGLLGNQEGNCGSPDSALGFGVEVGPGNGCYGTDPSYAVGVAGGAGCAPAGADATFFGYVFVR